MGEILDCHRMFLQAMMWKKVCEKNDILNVYKSCLEQCNVPIPSDSSIENDLHQFIVLINNYIKPMHLHIDKGADEVSGELYYALVNTVNNSISTLSSDYTPAELEFFKKLVESIVFAPNGKISSIAALNLVDQMEKRVSKNDIEFIIQKFLQDRWLCQVITNEGVISLSVRSLIELDYYLKSSFAKDILKCCLCQNIVLQGVTCSKCNDKVHDHCMKKYLKHQNCCPMCNEPWVVQNSSGSGRKIHRGRKRNHDCSD